VSELLATRGVDPRARFFAVAVTVRSYAVRVALEKALAHDNVEIVRPFRRLTIIFQEFP